MWKKRLAAAAAAVLGAVSGWCGSLSFQIVQHSDSMDEVCQAALAVEDEILNYFYEAGYIVTNAPAEISVSAAGDRKLWASAFSDAAYGSFDDFVQICLDFEDGGRTAGGMSAGRIRSVSWKAVAVASGRVLEEGSSAIKDTGFDGGEDSVREFASGFAAHLRRIIK